MLHSKGVRGEGWATQLYTCACTKVIKHSLIYKLLIIPIHQMVSPIIDFKIAVCHWPFLTNFITLLSKNNLLG